MAPRSPSSSVVGWVLVASLSFAPGALVGCSLALDTDELTAGDAGLDCSADEKVCPLSLEDLEGPRHCVDTTNPQTGCGAATCRPCEVPGAKPRCTREATCGISICLPGYADCDEREDNGCEVHVASEENNCGACNSECSIPGALANCIESECRFVVCLPGFFDCDENPNNGCEVDLANDPAHCGACDRSCPSGCTKGECE